MIHANHYQTLKVSHKATQLEIKQAYRRLAKQFHPDSQHQESDHDRIVKINAAYEILGDPERRHHYDRQLISGEGSVGREQRTTQAQHQYQRRRQAEKEADSYLQQWYQEIYLPTHRLICRILNPLDRQIDDLAADLFDDQLMEDFQAYLEHCRIALQKAKQIFTSQPNPSKLAKVAVSLYYCLNHIGDGIEELELFTLNYDDRQLHLGKELFRRANHLRHEAQSIASIVGELPTL